MVEEIRGRIFDIKRFALHDGPGIRTTLFLTGCPLSCRWCHNPESRVSDDQTEDRNRTITVPDAVEELKKDLVFFEESGGGVTFSGGEPLMQSDFLLVLLKEMGRALIHRALDTTGYAERKTVEVVLPHTDLFLYDLKIMDPVKHRELTGVDNRVILENLKVILDEGANVRIRFPLIPGHNDDENNIMEMVRFLERFDELPEIDILPYHRFGISKYKKLEMNQEMEFISPPSGDKIESVKEMLKTNGFIAGVGG